MTTEPSHVTWLKRKAPLSSADGKPIRVLELSIDSSDDEALSAWAAHFRRHYCLDAQIDRLRRGTGLTRAEYLTQLVFPDKTSAFGPATRSGDFAEILVSDLVQFKLGYVVPRTRYGNKKVRNESSKGTDVVGLRILSGDPTKFSKNDSVLTFETKAQLRAKSKSNRLQDAVDDCIRDEYRLAESLNAMKQRLLDLQDEGQADMVERFQEPLARPFKVSTGAAAIVCTSLFDEALLESTDCSIASGVPDLVLLVVHGPQLMHLVHALYERAASEA